MDKETLSNYGWIVICILVLSVMIALATPFGNFIAEGFKAAYVGFFQTGENALGIVIPGSGGGNENGSEDTKKYKYMDCVTQGQYNYFYTDCDSYEEYVIGTLNNYCMQVGGTPCDSRTDAIKYLAPLVMGQTWEELQAQGMTEEVFLSQLEITESQYGEIINSGTFIHGWWVLPIDRTLTTYDDIPEYVDGIPVTSLSTTFYNCTDMEIAPRIPSTVIDLNTAFECCTNLKVAPDLSHCTKIINMRETFYKCYSLTTAPVIPASVTNMIYTFGYCTSLTGDIVINATPTEYNVCFQDVDMSKITLAGSCNATLKQAIADTGKNSSSVTIVD